MRLMKWIFVLVCAGGLSAAFPGVALAATEASPGSERTLKFLDEFSRAARQADRVSLYVGMPRDFERKPAGEKGEPPAVKLHEQFFAPTPQPLAPEAGEKLRETVYHGALPFSGLKLCGGFHADYLFRWRTKQGDYDVLICFSCHEYKIFGPSGELYGDLRGKEYQALKEMFFKSQPGPPSSKPRETPGSG
jgi:hypothetical protein